MVMRLGHFIPRPARIWLSLSGTRVVVGHNTDIMTHGERTVTILS